MRTCVVADQRPARLRHGIAELLAIGRRSATEPPIGRIRADDEAFRAKPGATRIERKCVVDDQATRFNPSEMRAAETNPAAFESGSASMAMDSAASAVLYSLHTRTNFAVSTTCTVVIKTSAAAR